MLLLVIMQLIVNMAAGQTAIVSLENLAFFARMVRGAYTGVTTLSRSYLLHCNAGTRVRAVLAFGQLNAGPANYDLLTLLVMPYQPRSVTAASWAVYRSVLHDLLYRFSIKNEVLPLTLTVALTGQLYRDDCDG